MGWVPPFARVPSVTKFIILVLSALREFISTKCCSDVFSCVQRQGSKIYRHSVPSMNPGIVVCGHVHFEASQSGQEG